MDYLTKYYKNLSESLQQRIIHLEKLIEGAEDIFLDKDKLRQKKFYKAMDEVFNDKELVTKLEKQSQFEASVMGREENPDQSMPQLVRADAQRLALAALDKLSKMKPVTASDAATYSKKEMQKVADNWAKSAGIRANKK